MKKIDDFSSKIIKDIDRVNYIEDSYVLDVPLEIKQSSITKNIQQYKYDYNSDSSESESELLKSIPIEVISSPIRKIKQRCVIPVNCPVHASSVLTGMRRSSTVSSKNNSPDKNMYNFFDNIDINKEYEKDDDTMIDKFDKLVVTKSLDIKGSNISI